MKISGSNARHMVMQKLMRKTDVSVYILLSLAVKYLRDMLWCEWRIKVHLHRQKAKAILFFFDL